MPDLKPKATTAISQLLDVLGAASASINVSQSELARRSGVNRTTLLRMGKEGGDPSLATLVALGSALDLELKWVASEDASFSDQDLFSHKGAHIARTRSREKFKDVLREKALSETWLEINKPNHALPARMKQLLPQHDQAQATAVATVVQWLGSTEGFHFLQQALARAGLEIIKKPQESAPRKVAAKSPAKTQPAARKRAAHR